MTAVHWRDVKRGLKLGDELRIRVVDEDLADVDPAIETPPLVPLGRGPGRDRKGNDVRMSMRWNVLGAALAAAVVGLGPRTLAAQDGSGPDGDPADVASLDAIIAAYYGVVSGPAGETADRERDEWLHHPDALVAISGVSGEGEAFIRTMSLDEYHDAFGGTRRESFYEREIHREVQRFGNIAHAWSTYASSREPEGEPFARGINSIQLYHDGERWWIMGWMFDSERAGNPVPPGYLPAPGAQEGT